MLVFEFMSNALVIDRAVVSSALVVAQGCDVVGFDLNFICFLVCKYMCLPLDLAHSSSIHSVVALSVFTSCIMLVPTALVL